MLWKIGARDPFGFPRPNMQPMRKPRRRMELENSTRTQPGSGRTTVSLSPAKDVGLSVTIEAVATSKRSRGRKQPAEPGLTTGTGLDALAKLLVHHLEPELKEILK